MEKRNYMHITTGFGKLTAAINIEFDDENDKAVAFVGVAFCSPRDQYCKKTGRLVAAGRLDKGKYLYRLELDKEKQVSDQVMDAISSSIDDKADFLPRAWYAQ